MEIYSFLKAFIRSFSKTTMLSIPAVQISILYCWRNNLLPKYFFPMEKKMSHASKWNSTGLWQECLLKVSTLCQTTSHILLEKAYKQTWHAHEYINLYREKEGVCVRELFYRFFFLKKSGTSTFITSWRVGFIPVISMETSQSLNHLVILFQRASQLLPRHFIIRTLPLSLIHTKKVHTAA